MLEALKNTAQLQIYFSVNFINCLKEIGPALYDGHEQNVQLTEQ